MEKGSRRLKELAGIRVDDIWSDSPHMVGNRAPAPQRCGEIHVPQRRPIGPGYPGREHGERLDDRIFGDRRRCART
jgi:hypothetical protein